MTIPRPNVAPERGDIAKAPVAPGASAAIDSDAASPGAPDRDQRAAFGGRPTAIIITDFSGTEFARVPIAPIEDLTMTEPNQPTPVEYPQERPEHEPIIIDDDSGPIVDDLETEWMIEE